jgi:transcriptional regulator with XRE-family HTH domain
MLNGNEIKSRREKLGMSQAGLAKAAGLSQQNLSRLENNFSKGTRNVGKLAAVLGCDITDLDPDFGTAAMGEVATELSDEAASLISKIATKLSNQLGFRPTDVQVIHHLIGKGQYRDLLD